MTCTECGVALSSFDVVCPACGAPQQQQQTPAPPIVVTTSRPPRKNVGSIAMWIAIFVVFIIAGGVYEATEKTIAAMQPSQLSGDEAARMAQFQAAHDACDAMETMVAQSTQQLNAMDFEHALGSANEGLTHQDACTFDTKPAFAGILLSVKAIAEHFLSRGNAQADIEAANGLLEQCQAEQGPQDATNVRNCSDWLGKNRLYQQEWADGR